MPGANCLLGICCPPGSDDAKAALAAEIERDLGWSAEVTEAAHGNAYAAASWVLDNYDLAPHGSLRKLFKEVAALARENP